LVEDDPIVGTMVGAALEDIGCEILRASNADEALALLSAGQELELLLTDIVMPGRLNGIELAKEARTLRPNLRVILTTGYSEDLARADGMRVLGKPYRMETLEEAITAELSARPKLTSC
jgi:CheY-like chemotaxis protein